MENSLTVALFSTQPAEIEALRGIVSRFPWLDMVLETARWEKLESALASGELDVVMVNLDDDVEFGRQIVQQTVRMVPDMSVIGLSARTDPTTIISAMRAGCAQFVCAPVDPDDFRNALERIRASHSSASHKTYRLCVVGGAGGVGATTIACNLAIELAQTTSSTCALMDLNLEYGDAAFSFDCEPKYSIAHLCETGSRIDNTMVESAIELLPCNVALLSRPANVIDARAVTPEGVGQALQCLGSMYRYVVVDLPRAFSFLSAVALRDADRVLIIAQLNVPCIRNASRLYDLLLDMGAAEENIEIVLNRCRAEHQRVAPEDVESHFRRPIFAMIPNDYRRVTAASDFGHPIMTDSPNSPARLALHQLARTIATEDRDGEESPAANKGLFSRWWGGSKREEQAESI